MSAQIAAAAVGILVLVLVGLAAVRAPRFVAIGSAAAIVFGTGIGMGLDLVLLERTDEIAVVLLVVAGAVEAARHGPRWLPGSAYLAGLLLLQGIGALAADAPAGAAVTGLVLQAKCLAGAWGVLQIRWRAEDARLLSRTVLAFSLTVIAGTAANLMIGTSWSVAIAGYTETRFGLPTIVGLLPHPLALSFTGVVLIGLVILLKATPARVPFTPALVALLLVVVVLSGRRTGLLTGVVVLVLLLVSGRLRAPRRRSTWLVLPVLAGLVAAGWSQLGEVVERTRTEYLDGLETNPRWVMLRTSAEIARENWPLGSGSGTFGSAPSVTPYSQVYVDQGLQFTWGLSPEYPYFLLDSAWPGILGEGGWFAPVLMLVALGLLWRALARVENVAVRLVGLLGLFGGFVASFTAPVYTSAPYFLAAYLVPAAALGISASLGRSTADPGVLEEGEPAPDFSLVIATVDDDGDLEHCLRSITLLAPGPTCEVIVVDQNPIGTLDPVLARYAPLLRLQHLQTGIRGAAHARNLGAGAASAPWVLFLDDDARISADALLRCRDHSKAAPDLAVISGRTIDASGRSTVLRWSDAAGPLTRENTEGRLIESVTFLRTEDFRAVGGYDEDFGPGSRFEAAEGLDLVYRILDPSTPRRGWYDPLISVQHADAAPPWDDAAVDRGYRYSYGVGAVVGKHGRGPLRRVLVRTVLRASIGSLLPWADPGLRRYRRARVRGVLAGYRDYRSSARAALATRNPTSGEPSS